MYRFLQKSVRMLIKLSFRVTVIGLDKIPADEPVVLVSNHSAVIDSYLVASVIDRPMVFLSKQEHFESKGPMGWLTRFMVKRGAIPVDRSSPGSRGRAALLMVEKLKQGMLVALHPEGTRTPPGAVYKADPGFITIARRAGVKVVPIVLLGTENANPPGKLLPRFGASITMIIGDPIELPQDPEEALVKTMKRKVIATEAVAAIRRGLRTLREQTTGETELQRQARRVMERIAALGGMPYIDITPEEAKRQANDSSHS